MQINGGQTEYEISRIMHAYIKQKQVCSPYFKILKLKIVSQKSLTGRKPFLIEQSGLLSSAK